MRPLLLMIYDDMLQLSDCGVRVSGHGFHFSVQDLFGLPKKKLFVSDGLGQNQFEYLDTGELYFTVTYNQGAEVKYDGEALDDNEIIRE